MLMVIRVQATVKNVVRKMNNALTTIITNTAAYLPELIGEYAAVFVSVKCKLEFKNVQSIGQNGNLSSHFKTLNRFMVL